MRFATIVAAVSAFASVATAADFNITVGKDNANTFDPPQLTGVNVGDVLHFTFVSKSHSVTQSTFDNPCTVKPQGVDSGFFPVAAGATSFPQWSIRVNNVTGPLWFFCNRAPHCQASGMVFAVNPTAERTLDAFKAKALASTPGAPAPPTGGAPSASGTPSAGGATPTGTGSAPGTPGPGGAGVGGGASNTSTADASNSTQNGSALSLSSTTQKMTALLMGAAVLAGLSL